MQKLALIANIVADADCAGAWAQRKLARFGSMSIFSRHPIYRRMSVPGYGQSKGFPLNKGHEVEGEAVHNQFPAGRPRIPPRLIHRHPRGCQY